MPETNPDLVRPNSGRIYDYLLGGSHNFEVDRQAGEQMKRLLPFVTKTARMQRWCVQDIANELTFQRGYDVIIDFASGLPTEEHLHQNVKPGTTVIYSDQDPITVEYAREILHDVPNAFYFQADVCHPESLLTRPEVQAILQGRRDIAMVAWGVSMFISPENVQHLSRYLYDWSGPRSCLVFQAQGADVNQDEPSVAEALQLYRKMGMPMYVCSLDRYKELVQPWHADEKGFISVLAWHGLDQSIMTEQDLRSFGVSAIGYGAYLVK